MGPLPTGTCRFRHGAFDITVLSDGCLVVPAGFVAQDARCEQLQKALAGLDVPSMVCMNTNAPLIHHCKELILVDVVAGEKLQPTEGLLLGALGANGIDPASITKVVLTHAHPDCLWGVLGAKTELIYPNAAY